MFLNRNRNLRKLESCGLFWTGDSEPYALLSKSLRGGGLKICRIDKNRGRIIARITPKNDSGTCKVTLQIFPQLDVCLVVATLEPSRGSGEGIILDSLRILKSRLDNVRLVDEKGILDWKIKEPLGRESNGRGAGTIALMSDAGAGDMRG